jgi:hypothetical protein
MSNGRWIAFANVVCCESLVDRWDDNECDLAVHTTLQIIDGYIDIVAS